MANAEGSLAPQESPSELDIFREQWQAELRQRPMEKRRRLAYDHTDPYPKSNKLETHDITKPIWTLPHDVLREIFDVVAFSEPPASQDTIGYHHRLHDGSMHYRVLGWIRLTHVCRSWRMILLKMSGLWGRIVFTFPSTRAFPTFLARAGHALLDMSLHIPSQLNRQRWEAAMVGLERTRSLSLKTVVTRELLELLARARLGLPHLRELTFVLHGIGGASSSQLGFSNVEGPALENAAGEVAPFPDDIHIDGPNVNTAFIELNCMITRAQSYTLPSLHFSLPNLRYLEVRVLDRAPHIMNLHWFISVIRSSPLLELLKLTLLLRDDTPDWDALFQGHPICLPHLKKLVLDDCSSINLAPLFTRICAVAPPTCLTFSLGSTEFSPHGDPNPDTTIFAQSFGGYLCRSDNEALMISEALPARGQFQARDVFAFRSMSLPDDYDRSYALQHTYSTLVGNPCDSVNDRSELTENLVQLNVRLPPSSRDYTWFETLASRMGNNVLHIKQLFLSIPPVPEGEIGWLKTLHDHILKPMTALRTLCINVDPTRNYNRDTRICADIVNILIRSDSQPPMFPNLHTLRVNFWMENTQSWRDPLIHVLEQRRKNGYTIDALIITGQWTREFKFSVQANETQMMGRLTRVVPQVLDERVVCERCEQCEPAALQRLTSRPQRIF